MRNEDSALYQELAEQLKSNIKNIEKLTQLEEMYLNLYEEYLKKFRECNDCYKEILYLQEYIKWLVNPD